MSAHVSLPGCDSAGHCITCSDEGVTMRVLGVDAERSLAVCLATDRETAAGEYGAGEHNESRGEEEVAIDLVALVAVGDSLLVHAGVALANLGTAPLAQSEDARERAWSRLTITSGDSP